jgi:hypothetical protein
MTMPTTSILPTITIFSIAPVGLPVTAAAELMAKHIRAAYTSPVVFRAITPKSISTVCGGHAAKSWPCYNVHLEGLPRVFVVARVARILLRSDAGHERWVRLAHCAWRRWLRSAQLQVTPRPPSRLKFAPTVRSGSRTAGGWVRSVEFASKTTGLSSPRCVLGALKRIASINPSKSLQLEMGSFGSIRKPIARRPIRY